MLIVYRWIILIDTVTAWWHYQKDQPLRGIDRAHCVRAMESWHSRTHQDARCSFCFLAFSLFVSPHHLSIKKKLSCKRRFVVGGIDIRSLCCVSCSTAPNLFHVCFPAKKTQNMNTIARKEEKRDYSKHLPHDKLLTRTWFLKSAESWEDDADKMKVGNCRNVLIACFNFVQNVIQMVWCLCCMRKEQDTMVQEHVPCTQRVQRTAWCMQRDLSCWLLKHIPVSFLQESQIPRKSDRLAWR